MEAQGTNFEFISVRFLVDVIRKDEKRKDSVNPVRFCDVMVE